jgi:hypothetical protein
VTKRQKKEEEARTQQEAVEAAKFIEEQNLILK